SRPFRETITCCQRLDLSRRVFLAAGAATMAAPAFSAVGSEGLRPLVRIRSGELAGTTDSGVLAFKGVPYGEPTGGNARFLPPVAKQPWQGTFDASRFGPRSPQRGGLGGPDSPDYSEDC